MTTPRQGRDTVKGARSAVEVPTKSTHRYGAGVARGIEVEMVLANGGFDKLNHRTTTVSEPVEGTPPIAKTIGTDSPTAR